MTTPTFHARHRQDPVRGQLRLLARRRARDGLLRHLHIESTLLDEKWNKILAEDDS